MLNALTYFCSQNYNFGLFDAPRFFDRRIYVNILTFIINMTFGAYAAIFDPC